MAKIKRSLVKTFLNTGSIVSPTWVLIGAGVTSAKIDYNPKVVEETYITDDSATINVDSYAPTFPFEMTAEHTDAAFVYLDAMRKLRSTLSSAETEIVNVWLYTTPAGGYYHAEKQSCAIQFDDFGGDGGQASKLNYTINYVGDATLGIFKPAATATFRAKPVLAVLTTLVLGSGTLSPLFAADHYNQLYTTSIAAATVTMASTKATATIVQYDNADATVSQGAAASLSMGLNQLKIKVTLGSEEVWYNIAATRTA
jgi:hypothetical protein